MSMRATCVFIFLLFSFTVDPVSAVPLRDIDLSRPDSTLIRGLPGSTGHQQSGAFMGMALLSGNRMNWPVADTEPALVAGSLPGPVMTGASLEVQQVEEVPLPAAMWLFLSVGVGFFSFQRRRV